jgi:hypothetical protein
MRINPFLYISTFVFRGGKDFQALLDKDLYFAKTSENFPTLYLLNQVILTAAVTLLISDFNFISASEFSSRIIYLSRFSEKPVLNNTRKSGLKFLIII